MLHTPPALQALSVFIGAHLRRSGGEADPALARLLAATATPDWQAALCRSLLTDDAFAAEVAARSYRHANGFLKVVLLDRGFKLRLQLRLPGAACEENIHNHRWSSASVVLAGELHGETWADAGPNDADLQAREYCYLARVDERSPIALRLAGAHAPLRLIEHTHHRAGEHYALPAFGLHRILSHGQRMVATLMCSAPAQAGHTRLLTGSEGPRPRVAARRPSVAELRTDIGRFAALAGLFPAPGG